MPVLALTPLHAFAKKLKKLKPQDLEEKCFLKYFPKHPIQQADDDLSLSNSKVELQRVGTSYGNRLDLISFDLQYFAHSFIICGCVHK